MREITSGDGIGSAGLIAHFGLGDATNVDILRIEWPSGALQKFINVLPNEFLTIPEPAGFKDLKRLPDGSFQFSLIGAIGLGFNPRYNLETSDDLSIWEFWQSVVYRDQAITLIDTNVVTSARRFYRARQTMP